MDDYPCGYKVETMILDHGSNMEVKQPRIMFSGRRLDFGNAFYLTSDLEQASRWARLTEARRQEGRPTITVYEIDDSRFGLLSLKTFDVPNAKWLKYVAANRTGTGKPETADVIVGPVANDQTSPVIAMFLSGDLSVPETIRRLRPQQLRDQYAFRTEKAISLLNYKETIVI